MDQSSGHSHMRDNVLNTNTMSVRYGGKQANLRNTKIKDIGTYPRILDSGNEQSIVFWEQDQGPFYLDQQERACWKYDRQTVK